MSGDPRAALKRAAAEAAAALVTSGMVVGLGTGSTAYFAIEALIRRVREGLRITAIPTSERSAAQAQAGGIPLVDFATAPAIDITIDGADEIARAGLHLVKGLGGALLREKIVAAASHRLVIVADETKLVDQLGSQVPVPVEVVPFGWQATAAHLAKVAGEPKLRMADGSAPYRTDSGNFILDCHTGPIGDPAALDRALQAIVGVVETGLFIGRTAEVFLAGSGGVRRLQPTPLVLVVMGVSGSGKSTIAQHLADGLGWPFQEGDALHPEANVDKMRHGIPLTDSDRAPWLAAIAAWVAARVAAREHGIITCSSLKRAYREQIVGGQAGVSLIYLHAERQTLEQHLNARHHEFMPPALLDSQLDTLEPPGADEPVIEVDVTQTIEQTLATLRARLSI